MQNGGENYLFYLWVEYVTICHRWMKWYEDFVDLFWVKKIEED